MFGVDPRRWDFCLRHACKVCNLVPRKTDPDGNAIPPQEWINRRTMDPIQVVNIAGKRQFLRRFGCLTIFRPGRTGLTREQETPGPFQIEPGILSRLSCPPQKQGIGWTRRGIQQNAESQHGGLLLRPKVTDQITRKSEHS